MFGLLILVAVAPMVVACLGRQFGWMGVRADGMRKDCGVTVNELRAALNLPALRDGKASDAATLGDALREAGLELLAREGVAVAVARRKGLWLMRALPVLVMTVLAFAILSKRVSTGWALVGGMGLVGFWTLLRLTGLPVELKAVAHAAPLFQKARLTRRVDDEEEILRCARASIWNTVWPW